MAGVDFSVKQSYQYALCLYVFSESAEIVSVDAFNRPEPTKGLVVGISLILLKVQNQFIVRTLAWDRIT